MSALIILLVSTIIDYSVSAVLVGFAIALLVSKNKFQLGSYKVAAVIFCLFAFLDLAFYPALLSLDVTFTIYDAYIADLLEIGPNARLEEILSIGFVDFVVWGFQTVIAICVADKMKLKVANV